MLKFNIFENISKTEGKVKIQDANEMNPISLLKPNIALPIAKRMKNKANLGFQVTSRHKEKSELVNSLKTKTDLSILGKRGFTSSKREENNYEDEDSTMDLKLPQKKLKIEEEFKFTLRRHQQEKNNSFDSAYDNFGFNHSFKKEALGDLHQSSKITLTNFENLSHCKEKVQSFFEECSDQELGRSRLTSVSNVHRGTKNQTVKELIERDSQPENLISTQIRSIYDPALAMKKKLLK